MSFRPIQSNSIVFLQSFFGTTALTNSTTLGAVDSGKIIIIPPAEVAGTLNLPPLQAGIRYRLVCQDTIGFDITVTSPTPNTIYGNLIVTDRGEGAGNANSAVVKAGTTNFIITDTAQAGDWVEIVCDGEFYWIGGVSSATEGFA